MRNWLAQLCAAGGVLLAVTAAASAADVVKVGLIADYTGAFANWGTQFQQAVEAYQASTAKPSRDPMARRSRSSTSIAKREPGPDKTKQLAEELVLRERVKFLAGFDFSPYAMAMADICQQAKVPVIIMNAATASITRSRRITCA